MKNVFLVLVLVISFTSVSFGSVRIKPKYTPVTQEDIWAYRIIERNAQTNGLANPHQIWPNQQLYYYLPDGSDTTTLIAKGDNQTKIVKRIIREKDLAALWSINPPSDDQAAFEENQNPKKGILEFIQGLPWWVWLIVVFIIFAIIGRIISENQEKGKKKDVKFSEDPTKEGKPFVSDGVNNENQADAQFVNLARNSNPSLDPSNIVIKERKRGYVSTPNGESAVVEFADDTKQELAFRNTPGWQAMVSVDGGKKFKREVFFQDCGNPVYSRTSMKDSGLIITDEPIKFGNTESENPTPVVTEEKTETIEVEKSELNAKAEERLPEVSKVSGDHALVADEFLKTQKAHKVTMKYTKNANGDVTIESVFETKNEKTGTEGKDK